VYLWSIQWDVLTKCVSSLRKCSRWHALVVHILGWRWLPCMRIVLYSTIKANRAHLPYIQAYSLCSFYLMHLLHKHLRTCIIQDHKPRARSSYLRSSSRCSLRRCPKQTRRTLRNFRSAPITARAPSRKASPGAFFSPDLQLLINALLKLIHYVQELFATIAALYLVYLCYTISLLPWYPQSSQCFVGLDR
jgi:hypothetical protein